jgi:hypothetical protein
MELKKKLARIKTKIKQHPNCVAAIGSMLVTGAALGYYSGKELSKAKRGSKLLTEILDDFMDGEKHAAWLKDGTLYVQPEPLSEEDL